MFHWQDNSSLNYTTNKGRSLLHTQFCNKHHMQMNTFASQIPWKLLENGHSIYPYCFHHSLHKVFSVTLLPGHHIVMDVPVSCAHILVSRGQRKWRRKKSVFSSRFTAILKLYWSQLHPGKDHGWTHLISFPPWWTINDLGLQVEARDTDF